MRNQLGEMNRSWRGRGRKRERRRRDLETEELEASIDWSSSSDELKPRSLPSPFLAAKQLNNSNESLRNSIQNLRKVLQCADNGAKPAINCPIIPDKCNLSFHNTDKVADRSELSNNKNTNKRNVSPDSDHNSIFSFNSDLEMSPIITFKKRQKFQEQDQGDILCNVQKISPNGVLNPVLERSNLNTDKNVSKNNNRVAKKLFTNMNFAKCSQLSIDTCDSSEKNSLDLSNQIITNSSVDFSQQREDPSISNIKTSFSDNFNDSAENKPHDREVTIVFGDDSNLDSAKKNRRIKLPRDSLAKRLQRSIKKQESALTIWKHELFMAKSGNFELPSVKENNTLLLNILSSEEKFGHLLINCDKHDLLNVEYFTVIMNRHFVKSITTRVGWMFKIYNPFKIYKHTNSTGALVNVVVNVCKFDILKTENK